MRSIRGIGTAETQGAAADSGDATKVAASERLLANGLLSPASDPTDLSGHSRALGEFAWIDRTRYLPSGPAQRRGGARQWRAARLLFRTGGGDHRAMHESEQFLEQLSAMARSLEHEAGTQGTLDLAISSAASLIRSCDSAGISIVYRHGVHTRAASDESVHAALELQYEMGEGPAVDALRNHETVRSPDLRNDERWPEWGPRVAEELGVHSVLSCRLFTTDDTLGALNLFSRTLGAFDTEDTDHALALAAHVAVAVAEEQNDERLHNALASRTVIGQAQGILMERFDLSADQAFVVLVRFSTHQNIKLHRVASQLVATRRVPLRLDTGPQQGRSADGSL